MQKTKSRDRLAADAQQLALAEGLLLKYPRVRPDEIDSIARFLRHGGWGRMRYARPTRSRSCLAGCGYGTGGAVASRGRGAPEGFRRPRFQKGRFTQISSPTRAAGIVFPIFGWISLALAGAGFN